MLNVKLTVGPDALAIDGDVSLGEVLPVIVEWLAALVSSDQRRLNALTARGAVATHALEHAVADASPPSS